MDEKLKRRTVSLSPDKMAKEEDERDHILGPTSTVEDIVPVTKGQSPVVIQAGQVRDHGEYLNTLTRAAIEPITPRQVTLAKSEQKPSNIQKYIGKVEAERHLARLPVHPNQSKSPKRSVKVSPVHQPIEIDLELEPVIRRTLNVAPGIDHDEIKRARQPPGSGQQIMEQLVIKQVSIARKEATHEIIIKEDLEAAEEKLDLDNAQHREQGEKKRQQRRDQALCNKPIPKKTTFDGRTVDDLGTKDQMFQEFYPENFDLDSTYKFYRGECDTWNINEYKKQFVYAKNNAANKKRSYQQVQELIFDKVKRSLGEAVKGIPHVLEGNIKMWYQLLLKSPRLQSFYNDFSEELTRIMQAEMSKNKDCLEMYMLYPHKHQKKDLVNRQYTKRKDDPAAQHEQMMIENAISGAKNKFKASQQQKSKMQQITKAEEKKTGEKMKKDTEQDDGGEWTRRKELLSDFQVELILQTKNIDKLVASMDEAHTEFQDEIFEFDDDIERLEFEKRQKKLPHVPGLQIEKLIRDMSTQSSYTPFEVQKYSYELWMSLKEYEESIKAQELGLQLDLNQQGKQHHIRIERLKNQCSFRIEAMETAMAELKLRTQLQVEQAMMHSAELESRIMNAAVPDEVEDRLIRSCEERLVLRNTAEARLVINQLVTCLKNNQRQLRHQAKTQEKDANAINLYQEENEKYAKLAANNTELRIFYQQRLMKFLRDANLYENHAKLSKFEEINETSKDMDLQMSYKQILEKLDLRGQLIALANRIAGVKISSQALQARVEALGLPAASSQNVVAAAGLNKDSLPAPTQSPNSGSSRQLGHQLMRQESLRPRRQPSRASVNGGLGLAAAVKEELAALIQKIIDGDIDEPVATVGTGLPVKVELSLNGKKYKSQADKDKKRQQFVRTTQRSLTLKPKSLKRNISPTSATPSSQGSTKQDAQQNQKRGNSWKGEPRHQKKQDSRQDERMATRTATQNAKKSKNTEVKRQSTNASALSGLQLQSPQVAAALKKAKTKAGSLSKNKTGISKKVTIQDDRDEVDMSGSASESSARSRINDQTVYTSSQYQQQQAPAPRPRAKADEEGMACLRSLSISSHSLESVSTYRSNKSATQSPMVKLTVSKRDVLKAARMNKKKKSLEETNYKAGKPTRVGAAGGSRETSEDRMGAVNETAEDASGGSSPMARTDNSGGSSYGKANAVPIEISCEDVDQQRSPAVSGHRKSQGASDGSEQRDIVDDDGLSRLSEMDILSRTNLKFKKKAASKHRQPKSVASEEQSEMASNKTDKSGRGRKDATKADGARSLNLSQHLMENKNNDQLKEFRTNNGNKASVLSRTHATHTSMSKSMAAKQRSTGRNKQQRDQSQPSEGLQSSHSKQNLSEDEVEEPRLKGIHLIEQELSQLIAPKYEKLKQKCQKGIEEDEKLFKMNGNECIEMQVLVQNAIGTKLSADDYMDLYVANMQEFFQRFNDNIVKEFKFGELNEYIQNVDAELDHLNENPAGLTTEESAKDLKAKKNLKQVSFGDMLKPCINRGGEFMGLQVRPELAQACYISSDCDLKALKRVVRICSFVNRMMRDGKAMDFRLLQGVGEEKGSLAERAIQVDVKELQMNVEPVEKEEELEEEKPFSPAEAVFDLLKNHAIEVLTRTTPRKNKKMKKGYYALIWEDFTLEQLLEYRLAHVFKDAQDLRENAYGLGATFAEYLTQVFASLQLKIGAAGFAPDDEAQLVVDDFVRMGTNQPVAIVNKVQTVDASVGTPPPLPKIYVKEAKEVFDAFTQVDDELGAVQGAQASQKEPKISSIQTKTKNQLILDKAMEEEFMKTIQTMDQYVGQLYKRKRQNSKRGGTSEAAAPQALSLAFSRPESQTAVATSHSQRNQDFSVNDSIYDIQQKSIVQKKTASIDHEMKHFRDKIDSVVLDMKQSITLDLEKNLSKNINQYQVSVQSRNGGNPPRTIFSELQSVHHTPGVSETASIDFPNTHTPVSQASEAVYPDQLRSFALAPTGNGFFPVGGLGGGLGSSHGPSRSQIGCIPVGSRNRANMTAHQGVTRGYAAKALIRSTVTSNQVSRMSRRSIECQAHGGSQHQDDPPFGDSEQQMFGQMSESPAAYSKAQKAPESPAEPLYRGLRGGKINRNANQTACHTKRNATKQTQPAPEKGRQTSQALSGNSNLGRQQVKEHAKHKLEAKMQVQVPQPAEASRNRRMQAVHQSLQMPTISKPFGMGAQSLACSNWNKGEGAGKAAVQDNIPEHLKSKGLEFKWYNKQIKDNFHTLQVPGGGITRQPKLLQAGFHSGNQISYPADFRSPSSRAAGVQGYQHGTPVAKTSNDPFKGPERLEQSFFSRSSEDGAGLIASLNASNINFQSYEGRDASGLVQSHAGFSAAQVQLGFGPLKTDVTSHGHFSTRQVSSSKAAMQVPVGSPSDPSTGVRPSIRNAPAPRGPSLTISSISRTLATEPRQPHIGTIAEMHYHNEDSSIRIDGFQYGQPDSGLDCFPLAPSPGTAGLESSADQALKSDTNQSL